MKSKFFSTVLLASVLAFTLPSHSTAAPLGLTTLAPTLEADFSFVDYLEFGQDGDLSTFGAGVSFAHGVSLVGLAEIGFGVGFSLLSPTIGATGGFDVFDANGLFLGGELMAVGFYEDVIELQFGNLVGAGVGSFGSSVLALIAFDDQLGPNPFSSLVDGDSYVTSIRLSNIANLQPVPEPAGWSIFMTALLGLGWFGRRRHNQS